MRKYESLPEHYKFVKLVGKNDYIDTSKLTRHQECYLLSDQNELVSESVDGTRHILGVIEDFMFAR